MAKVLQTLKKKAQATPVVGVILDSLKSENPRQNAPSIQAVIDNMTPPQNLLINGDFQINQRGQSSYSSNLSERSYGIDMWCSKIGNGQTLTVYPAGKDGVRLAGSSISGQYFQELEHIENGKNHVLSTKIQIRSGNGTIRLLLFNGTSFKTKDLVDGYNEFDLGTENIHRVGLEISGTVDFFCNYIRLGEGSIAYPHVKNSYAYDLMECQLIVKPLDTTGIVMYEYGDTANQYYYIFDVVFEEMIGKPTISTINAMYFSENGIPTHITPTINEITKNHVRFETPRGAKKNIYSNGIRVSCWLSCEPL